MSQDIESSELRPEYDFSGGVRGKHFEAYREGTNVVLLDSDIARVFRDSASVNRALRLLLDLATKEVGGEKRPGTTEHSGD
jgi:hypothetical protein